MKKYEWKPTFNFPKLGEGEGWSYWNTTNEYSKYLGYVCREYSGKYCTGLCGGNDEMFFFSMREAAINLIERIKEKEKTDQVIPESVPSFPRDNAPKARGKKAV